jgi:hypothetical protein
MELVEGPTLADRIAQGALPVDEALPIAMQIAEALEAAHEQGIVHRDLKPANIKVRPDGTVKVLDFGLAKALEAASAVRASGTQSPTITSPAMTQAGIILGTAAYMSPEQAKGKAVDKRSDVWAFGAVLYEMLAGRRAFDGEDVSDLIVAVLSKDVDLQALPSDTPPGIVRLIRRCLVRDPRQRLRDIGEARIALARMADGVVDDEAATAALITALVWPLLRTVPATPVRILDVPDTAGARSVALSADGMTVAYATSDGLYLRRLDAAAATRLVDRDDVRSLTFRRTVNRSPTTPARTCEWCDGTGPEAARCFARSGGTTCSWPGSARRSACRPPTAFAGCRTLAARPRWSLPRAASSPPRHRCGTRSSWRVDARSSSILAWVARAGSISGPCGRFARAGRRRSSRSRRPPSTACRSTSRAARC